MCDRDLSLIVEFAFLSILGRAADPGALNYFKRQLRSGMTVEDLAIHLAGSDEARGSSPGSNASFAIPIMGSDQILTRQIWNQKLATLDACSSAPAAIEIAPFRHSGRYDVTAIASIYKAGPYIERLLENITSQSIFDRSELIIIDANSPDGEGRIIEKYQERFPNIVYRREPTRISIYEAWNVGVGLSRGKYITNTNADDLRRRDSFELQACALDESGADVVYQNFYYSLDPTFSFEKVAEMGFVSTLPQVNSDNLIRFNAPHNAPMWKRDLHLDVGLFDSSLKSAGDWEFWLRCLTRGKRFHRVDAAHVSYFVNPDGVSTSGNSSGPEEIRTVSARYRTMIIDSYLGRNESPRTNG
ncbi:MAG: hypothetical protein CTY15_07445 [Methylocystis sp.]|nr:MAG: hypothetical protein CTY15_07445 [Methylocystis sp.]